MEKKPLYTLWLAVLMLLLALGAALFFTGIRDHAKELAPPTRGGVSAQAARTPFL